MSEVVVVGSFTVQEGKEEEATQAMAELMAPTHEESGCILYALHRGSDDPKRLAFVERWASR
jgi:quinol monooxygenase YgiN